MEAQAYYQNRRDPKLILFLGLHLASQIIRETTVVCVTPSTVAARCGNMPLLTFKVERGYCTGSAPILIIGTCQLGRPLWTGIDGGLDGSANGYSRRVSVSLHKAVSRIVMRLVRYRPVK